MTEQLTTNATPNRSRRLSLSWQSWYFAGAALAGLVSVVALALYLVSGFDFPGGVWFAIDAYNLVLAPALLAALFGLRNRIWAGVAAVVAPIIMLVTDELLLVLDAVFYNSASSLSSAYSHFAYYLPILGRALSLSDGTQGMDAQTATLHTLLHSSGLVSETMMVGGFVIGILAIIGRSKARKSATKSTH
jgi:hypothetical protein